MTFMKGRLHSIEKFGPGLDHPEMTKSGEGG